MGTDSETILAECEMIQREVPDPFILCSLRCMFRLFDLRDSANTQGKDKGMAYILLAVLVFLSSACAISNYSPSEPVGMPAVDIHHKVESVSFSYLPQTSRDIPNDSQTLPWESQTVKDLFEHHSRFSKVIVTSIPPQNGTHINVYQTGASSVSRWCFASIWTLGVVPCYADGVLYTIHFDVLIHNNLKESYQYEISRKGVQWLGLLPFVWVNVFTTQYKDAFSANAYQFVIDAKRDGYL
jgi:hypothetical protein